MGNQILAIRRTKVLDENASWTVPRELTEEQHEVLRLLHNIPEEKLSSAEVSNER